MATRSRRLPTGLKRKAAGGQVTDYQRTRAAIALGVFTLGFGVLWMINGSFTVERAVMLFGVDAVLGWAIHIGLSAIELAPIFVAPFVKTVPKWVGIALLLVSVPFAAFDVYSSAIGMQPWLVWTTTTGFVQNLQNTLLGEVLAFAPEPMIFWLLVLILRTLKG